MADDTAGEIGPPDDGPGNEGLFGRRGKQLPKSLTERLAPYAKGALESSLPESAEDLPQPQARLSPLQQFLAEERLMTRGPPVTPVTDYDAEDLAPHANPDAAPPVAAETVAAEAHPPPPATASAGGHAASTAGLERQGDTAGPGDSDEQKPSPTPADSLREEAAMPAPPEPDVGSDAASVSSPRSTAAAFTEEAMLRAQPSTPQGGWQRLLHRVTGGLVTPGPSAADIRERAMIATVKTPIRGCRKVAVISRKGGVGKTTTTLMLGHTFAAWRGDRVVALDGNPDAGSLGYRVRRETNATVTDLLDDGEQIIRYADIRSYTSQAPTRLEVIASDDDPHISQAIGEDEYQEVIRLLEHHYNLILLDTGTGILDSATQGILRVADQLVVVTGPSLDVARAASLTLDWLDNHGYSRLVSGSVAVINQTRAGGLVEIDRVEEHFAGRCRSAVRIPWDPHLDAGSLSSLDELKPTTRAAYLAMAAAVAQGFSGSQGT